MRPDFSIRLATEQDAESIARLSAVLGYDTSAEAMRRRLGPALKSDADLVLAAVRADGAMLGWLQAHAAHIIESGFRVEITGLVVAPEVRRGGVGRALVAAAEEWARKRSATVLVVRSNIQRPESHQFYPALGFTTSKTQIVYRKPLK